MPTNTVKDINGNDIPTSRAIKGPWGWYDPEFDFPSGRPKMGEKFEQPLNPEPKRNKRTALNGGNKHANK